MVISVAELLAEKNSVISFTDTVSIVLEQNDFLDFHDVVQFIYRNFNLVSHDINNSLASCSYNRIQGVFESDEISNKNLDTLKHLISSNWISGIENENNGQYFILYNDENYENGSQEEFFFRKENLIHIFSSAGISFRIDMTPDTLGHVNEINGLEDKEELKSVINSLSDQNSKLKSEIDELKNNKPKHLGLFREDDPLLIAINIRNNEWSSFDEDNARITTPSADYVIEKLKEQYGMSHALASAIERVACPIVRKTV